MILLLLLCLTALTVFSAFMAGINHGKRLGLRQHARICACPSCSLWLANLKARGELNIWGDEP